MKTKTERILRYLFLVLMNYWMIWMLYPLTKHDLICWGLLAVVTVAEGLVLSWSFGLLPDEGLTLEDNVAVFWAAVQVVQVAVLMFFATPPFGAPAWMLLIFLLFWWKMRAEILSRLMDIRYW